MHVELIHVALVGIGAWVDMARIKDSPLSGEDIKMSIDASLSFPEQDIVECLTNVETASESTLRLKVTYHGAFRLASETGLRDADQAKISAACTARLFPYIRETIADVSRRLPIAAPITLHPSLGDEHVVLRQMNLTYTGPSDSSEKPQ